MVSAHRLARAVLMVMTESASVAEALTRVEPHDHHPHVAAALQNLSWVCRQRGLGRCLMPAPRRCLDAMAPLSGAGPAPAAPRRRRAALGRREAARAGGRRT